MFGAVMWLENIYFPTNLKRSRENLEVVIDWLEKNGLSYIKPVGGLYIYVNFSKVSIHTSELSVMGELIWVNFVLHIVFKCIAIFCNTAIILVVILQYVQTGFWKNDISYGIAMGFKTKV